MTDNPTIITVPDTYFTFPTSSNLGLTPPSGTFLGGWKSVNTGSIFNPGTRIHTGASVNIDKSDTFDALWFTPIVPSTISISYSSNLDYSYSSTEPYPERVITGGLEDYMLYFSSFTWEFGEYPISSIETDIVKPGSIRSFKASWSSTENLYQGTYVQLYIPQSWSSPLQLFNVEISVWVYVPEGSPDIYLDIGDGQYASTYDNPYITPKILYSEKNTWTEIVLNVLNDQFMYLQKLNGGSYYNYDYINIEPVYPNGGGSVYIDSLTISVTPR